MATIHIPEAEAVANFSTLLNRVRAGEEVVIESGARPIAVLRPASLTGRSISEAIAMMEAYSQELGHKPVMDPGFTEDMEAIIYDRKPADRSAWDESENQSEA